MTLNEAEKLLNENGIAYEQDEYATEAEFWLHISSDSYLNHASPCNVVVLIIRNTHHDRNLELQFNESDGDYIFKELWFGKYDCELFDCQEEYLAVELIEEIQRILNGKVHIIIGKDAKSKIWRSAGAYLESDDVTTDDTNWYHKQLARIEGKKSWFSKLLRRQTEYEIYDWNTYRYIVK